MPVPLFNLFCSGGQIGLLAKLQPAFQRHWVMKERRVGAFSVRIHWHARTCSVLVCVKIGWFTGCVFCSFVLCPFCSHPSHPNPAFHPGPVSVCLSPASFSPLPRQSLPVCLSLPPPPPPPHSLRLFLSLSPTSQSLQLWCLGLLDSQENKNRQISIKSRPVSSQPLPPPRPPPSPNASSPPSQ